MARALHWLGTLLLVALATFLSFRLYQVLTRPQQPLPVAGDRRAADGGGTGDTGTVAGPVVASPPVGDFAAVVEHPLFTPDRTPHQSPSPAQEGATSPSSARPGGGPFLVVGIVVTAEERLAILRPAGGRGPAVRVREGDSLGEWRVRRIDARQVVLGRGAATDVLKLNDDRLDQAGRRTPLPSRPRGRATARPASEPPRQERVRTPVR
ncbi:MAG TPA: hypothetical protein ENI96_00390 [Sedimenticola thiotaurini]|uniref:Type II secretion system protein GspC N-terminal domain-containing protein n=1 Tax=Sedimenticola thiotaurini TaxID=1543721 RepID=A0A831RL37_9GAMM|nr:hypothetical protein [Sedimenticola thiotaurini]